MRNGIAVLAGMVLMALSACGGEGTDTSVDAAAASTLSPTTAASWTSASTSGALATIPDGTYSRVVVREDAIAAGFDPELVDDFLGADGELPITYKVAGHRFTHFVTNDAGIAEPGDIGTASYDDEGRWVTVSESVGCPGCVQVLAWSLVDGSLTLSLVSVDGQRPYPDDERLVVEGVYEEGP